MIFSTRRVIIPCLLLILVDQILCSGSSVIDEKEVFGHHKDPKHGKRILFSSSSISTTQMDITTPIITPTTPTSNTPTSPLYRPAPVNPTTTNPRTTSPTSSSGGSWCVASKSASETALQVALDYACGYGGADCSAIQPGGICYNPNSVRDHASYAFNNYYQKKPLPTSCNFGGTAVIATTDPSSGTCQFSSTSTSATILNITNPRGPSTVFGSTPSTSSTTSSTAAMPCYLSRFFITTTCFMVLLPRTHFLNLLNNYY